MTQNTRRFAWLLIALAVMVVSITVPSLAQVPIVRSSIHNDVSPAVRDLPTLPNSALPQGPREAEPVRPIPLPPGLKPASEPDSVWQRTTAVTPDANTINATAFAATTDLGFDGVGTGFPGFTVSSTPPDTNGAVGATQFVQWVNNSFAVFDKATGALISGPTAGNLLWTGFGGGCEMNNLGDPIVLYDKLAKRWVFSQISVTSGSTPFLQCVAVSTTSDATGTFNRYSFSYSTFNDYPKIGVWPDAYYATFNMYQNNIFIGSDACAYDRNAMLAGHSAATQVCFQQGTSVGGLLPSDVDGTTPPPAGSPNFMMSLGANSSLNLFKFHVDFATPSHSTFTGPTVISAAGYTALCAGNTGLTCVPQSGTTNQLDSLGDRLMYRLAYRNFGSHESLVVNHSVATETSGGVRWYEIQSPNGTPFLAQQSTFAPDSKYRWMGSIAMDKAGDMAMGYSVSSSSTFPSIAFTGRVPSDPASTMETETTIINGSGSQTGNRWGDYSSIAVDPVDDCTFWYTTEYLKTTGIDNWSTRIANFKFPNCNNFTLSASLASLSITQGSSGSNTITVNPSPGGFNGSVSLSASGLPAGVTASFSPNPTTSSSTLTLTAGSTATIGTATVTITGTSGSLTHTTTITLTVNPPPDFSLSASPSSLSVTQGSSGSSTITETDLNGFTGSVSLSASGLPSGVTASFSTQSILGQTTSTKVVTFTASSTATTGTATVTIRGTSGTLTHTTTIALTVNASVPPDFSLSASPSSLSTTQGNSISSTITVNPFGGFTGSVSLSASGLPSGVTASFGTNPTTSSSSVTFRASSTATTGTATVTIRGTSGTLTHTTSISLTIKPPTIKIIGCCM